MGDKINDCRNYMDHFKVNESGFLIIKFVEMKIIIQLINLKMLKTGNFNILSKDYNIKSFKYEKS